MADMRIADIENLLDGCALLEYCGNLYEYSGYEHTEAGTIRYIFQNVNDDTYIKTTFETLCNGKEYDVK